MDPSWPSPVEPDCCYSHLQVQPVSSRTLLMCLAMQITTETSAFTNVKRNSTHMAINCMDNPNLFLLICLLGFKFALDTHTHTHWNAVGLSKSWYLMLALSRNCPPGPGLIQLLTPRLLSPQAWWLALRAHILLSVQSDLEFTRAHSHGLRRESAATQKIIREGGLVRIQERLQWSCTGLS